MIHKSSVIDSKAVIGKDVKIGPFCIIEDDVIIGSNATILPIKIVSGAIVGAGSVVTKDILEPGKYAGNPAPRRYRHSPRPRQSVPCTR